MTTATIPIQRRPDARLLVVGSGGRLCHSTRTGLPRHLYPGDVLVANDAATIPASLRGVHEPSEELVEVRLAGRQSLRAEDVRGFVAVVFGPGDFRTRTEDRPPPPPLRVGDTLRLGPLRATVTHLLDHPRLAVLRFSGDADTIWAGIAAHGRPIQYAHVDRPLALWDVWTPIAALPAAFEPPSAGFVLDWSVIRTLAERDIDFATITHAAGISSTGDPVLDARLPFAEPYDVPAATVRAIARARARGGRVVAVGTTVTRALEHAATGTCRLRAGPGLATQRIGPGTRLRVVDALITGVHEPGTSHYQLLGAFAPEDLLRRVDAAIEQHGYFPHEFGDAILIEKQPPVDRHSVAVSALAESLVSLEPGCVAGAARGPLWPRRRTSITTYPAQSPNLP